MDISAVHKKLNNKESTLIDFVEYQLSTKLDLSFTTYHNSSHNFATLISSVFLNLVIVRSFGFGSNI